jgi:predicted AAA+ superfamily ATPase
MRKGGAARQYAPAGCGHGAHDVLLWGARGSGKSALVKAAVGAVQSEGLAVGLVEVPGDRIATLPGAVRAPRRCAARVRAVRRRSRLRCGCGRPAAAAVAAGGWGGGAARNVRLHVTANRRHIVPRDIAEQESAISARDVMDDRLALADRFGLSLGFHVADQDQYVAMVAGYAAKAGLAFDPQEAIAWATARGGRSGRVAWQYAVELAGRAGRAI